MLPKEENEIVTRVGPGRRWATRCGAIGCRRCSPAKSLAGLRAARVRLLGEDLVAFRDSKGRIGLLTNCARTGSRRYTSDAMRNAVCAAFITVGSSTSKAPAST